MQISGHKILVTGATGGIGKAVAQQLAEAGGNLLLTGRNGDRLKQIADALPGQGHCQLTADLVTDQGLQDIRQAAEDFGVNVIINSLGINQLATLDSMSAGDISCLMATNLTAPINICRVMLPQLIQQPEAAIINIGSILGSIGYAGSTAYCASKFGLRGFTESLRRELADSNIRVIYFAPRATATDINCEEMEGLNSELGNAVDNPDQVAHLLLQALKSSHRTSFYLGWPEKFFVRVNALLPSMVDGALAKQLPTIKRFCKSVQTG